MANDHKSWGVRTSLTLRVDDWAGMQEMAREQGTTASELVRLLVGQQVAAWRASKRKDVAGTQ